jgi:hypothetical protein
MICTALLNVHKKKISIIKYDKKKNLVLIWLGLDLDL